jgi:uncharacterized protein YjiS (DUF1127 family)
MRAITNGKPGWLMRWVSASTVNSYAVRSLALRRSRRDLLLLDDRMLKDIGVDWATAQVEGAKPFWQD